MGQAIVELLRLLVLRLQSECRGDRVARFGELPSHREFRREIDPRLDVAGRGMHGRSEVLNGAGGVSAAR